MKKEKNAVFERAVGVFENLDVATDWFNSPAIALDGKTPAQSSETTEGAIEVLNLLGRIEQGIFS